MKEIELTDDNWNLLGVKAYVTKEGIIIDNMLTTWNHLCNCMQAASQCCKEGTEEHDDLLQASVSYLPLLQKKMKTE